MKDAVALSAANVRGLAHPLRVEMLGWLREHGPVTATGLAAAIGQSSGTTSYHLRRLAHFGFIVDAPDLGRGRERWWQAAHAMTTFDIAGERGTQEQALGLEYLRGVVATNCAAMVHWVDTLGEATANWRNAGTTSDWLLKLTTEQSRHLIEELEAVVERHRDGIGAPSDDEQAPVVVQIQVLPRPRPNR